MTLHEETHDICLLLHADIGTDDRNIYKNKIKMQACCTAGAFMGSYIGNVGIYKTTGIYTGPFEEKKYGGL